ncbi:MAG: hypothetical protein ACK4M9_12085 [Anaerobacillus sp.]
MQIERILNNPSPVSSDSILSTLFISKANANANPLSLLLREEL